MQVCSHADSCSNQTWIIKLKIVAQLHVQGPCDFETGASPDSPYVVRATRPQTSFRDCCVCCLSRFTIAIRRGVQGNCPVDAEGRHHSAPCTDRSIALHFAPHSWSALSGLRQLSLQRRRFACMTDNPLCSTSGRSEPARFNGGAITGSLAAGRKLQPKRFVRQQVCAAIFSTNHCPC